MLEKFRNSKIDNASSSSEPGNYEKAFIKINLNKNQKIAIEYEGAYVDVIGLSLDMINGLIYTFDKNIKRELWIYSIFDINTFLILVQSESNKNINDCHGHIMIETDKTGYIKSDYSGDFASFVLMFNTFITNLCKKQEIELNEYYELLENAFDSFIKEKCYERMNIITNN